MPPHTGFFSDLLAAEPRSDHVVRRGFGILGAEPDITPAPHRVQHGAWMLGSDYAGTGEYARSHPALTDAQTGLANRLHFELVYNYLFEAGNRGLPFTVMLVSTGSEEGVSDAKVRALGQAIEKTTRNSDLVSHVGNGRYVVLLLGTNLQGGRIAADRIEFALDGLASGTISFGLAAYSDDLESSEGLLKAADTALLAAEASGGGVEFG